MGIPEPMSGQDDDKTASPESFTIDFDDDLLSAALAAVDARAEESKRTRKAADPNEMAEIEASIEVDEVDLGEDGIVVGGEATV
ncbi:MAG: hypothetical protein QGG40_21130, partial [Myxococcota bacterium]|nr:hypothetical protein [Myxococcota bacterium]